MLPPCHLRKNNRVPVSKQLILLIVIRICANSKCTLKAISKKSWRFYLWMFANINKSNYQSFWQLFFQLLQNDWLPEKLIFYWSLSIYFVLLYFKAWFIYFSLFVRWYEAFISSGSIRYAHDSVQNVLNHWFWKPMNSVKQK